MKPCGKPWSQLSDDEKIEVLHQAQEQFRKSLNKLARRILSIENEYVLTDDFDEEQKGQKCKE